MPVLALRLPPVVLYVLVGIADGELVNHPPPPVDSSPGRLGVEGVFNVVETLDDLTDGLAPIFLALCGLLDSFRLLEFVNDDANGS